MQSSITNRMCFKSLGSYTFHSILTNKSVIFRLFKKSTFTDQIFYIVRKDGTKYLIMKAVFGTISK